MSIKSMFFNAIKSGNNYDRVYDSNDFSSYLDKIVGNGVFPGTLNLKVEASSGMNVLVNPGHGWINGHKIINTASLTLNLSSAHGTETRYDSVIMYLDMNDREMGIKILNGTAGSGTPAALTQTDERYELRLATITVAAGATSISGSNISDKRGTSDCPWVTGLIDVMDASELYEHWQNQFDAWFATALETLEAASGGVSGVSRQEFNITTGSGSLSRIDVTNYYADYNPNIDLVSVYISGLKLNPDEFTKVGVEIVLTRPVNTSGTVVNVMIDHFVV